ncbi:MAG: CIS tube protein [Armatimonadota bacterium]
MENTKITTGYLVDVVTRESLSFQYNPDEITDEKSTDFATIKVPGMSHPRYQYVAGEARRISFKLSFFKGDVKKKVTWLQSLLYPEHEKTMLRTAPHKVLFFFGDLYSGVPCIVRQVRVRYFHMFDQVNLLPQHAEIDIALEEIVNKSVSYTEVRR